MAYKVPIIKKEESILRPFYKKRVKYYLFGTLAGAGLMSSAYFLSRNPYEYITGMVLVGTSTLGYVRDYATQLGRAFRGKKIYTFEDGTKILADSREGAKLTYEKHQHHKKAPIKYELFHSGTHER